MNDTSKNEILEAIAGLGEAISLMADQLQDVSDRMETRFVRVESQMVTKSYLDDKIGDLRGGLVLLCRKSNTKLSTLVEQLVADGTLKRSVADRILEMEPFAQVS